MNLSPCYGLNSRSCVEKSLLFSIKLLMTFAKNDYSYNPNTALNNPQSLISRKRTTNQSIKTSIFTMYYYFFWQI